MLEQYEGTVRVLLKYARKNKYEREEVHKQKSHDFHVLMTQLLPVALRGILPENVRLAIVKLCAFLNEISQKAIDPEKLIQL